MQLPNIRLSNRDKLYFGKFKYRLEFCLPDARLAFSVRSLSEVMRDIKNSPILYHKEYENLDQNALKKFAEFRDKYHPKGQASTTAGIYSWSDHVRIFTNDIDIIDEAIDLSGKNFQLTQAIVLPQTPGVMFFARQPRFKYRTYFKSKLVDEQWKTKMLDFLNKHSSIVPSGSLKKFITNGYKWSRYLESYHFVEYDHPGGQMILTLFLDGREIGKHYQLLLRE